MNPYYADDLVTLYLGDCREVTEWLSADVLVTDPPYGVRWESRPGAPYAQRTKSQPTRNQLRQRDVLLSDMDTTARDDVRAAWGMNRPAIMFGSWRVTRPAGVRSLLIWHKDGAAPGPLNAAFFTNHEEIYVMGDGAWRKSAPPLRSVITTREHRSQATRDAGHPTPKPIALMEMLIDRCPPGTIADPFAGSGSTLVAARNQGRRAVGVEIDERYAEMAARRLSQGILVAS